MRRIVFYSKEDAAWTIDLPKSESVLDNLSAKEYLDINDALELYSVKLYFDNDIFLPEWDNDVKSQLSVKVNNAFEIVRDYFLKISNDTIAEQIDKLAFEYVEAFWNLIQKLEHFKKIDKYTFEVILKRVPHHINAIILNDRIVKYYSNQIRSFLLDYKRAAELLLSSFEQEHHTPQKKKFFPASLTLEDREFIIDKYLETSDVNPNYVTLIINSKKSQDLRLSTRIRQKATKLNHKLTSDLFKNNAGIRFGVNVSIKKNQKEPAVSEVSDDTILNVTYGELFLDKIQSSLDFMNLFKSLFGFINSVGTVQFLNHQKEEGIWQYMGLNSKNEYPIGPAFYQSNMLSIMQIVILENYLFRKRDFNFNSLFEAFINHLNGIIAPNQINFRLPSVYASYYEKNSVYAASFEVLIRQYRLYVLDKEIDHHLVNLNSDTLNFGEIESLLPKKYIYSNGATIVNGIAAHFFSPNSMLLYALPQQDKYETFNEYINYEKLTLKNFSKGYQQNLVQQFIDAGYLGFDEDNFLFVVKDIEVAIIGQLYYENVLSYWHYTPEVRVVLDKMLENNLLESESRLFTRAEVDYLNFNLNDKKYTNGYKLKNKYSHGFIVTDEIDCKNDYYYYLRIIILGLLKIEDDLLLYKNYN